MNVLLKLDSVRWLHALAKILRLRFFAGCVLGAVPLVRRLGNYRYRMTSLESFFLVGELFYGNTYREAISPGVKTIADVGCNAGYFPILVAWIAQCPDLKGLMVDANPQMVEEARWNVRANHFGDLHVRQGMAGAEGETFYLHPSNLGSSQFAIDEPGKLRKGEWREIKTPKFELEKEWRERFGDMRCHLLKVDIEGSEGGFFRQERAFLERTDQIVLEWHKWVITLPELEQILGPSGFVLKKIIREEENTGIAWFVRR